MIEFPPPFLDNLADRSLWIGLFLDMQTLHDPIKAWLPEAAPDQDDAAHVTALFLGKSPDGRALDRAQRAAQALLDFPAPPTIQLTGFAYFWRRSWPHPVLLVNSLQGFDWRANLRTRVQSAAPDDYGWVPHVTLRSKHADETWRTLGELHNYPPQTVAVSPWLVCGNYMLNVPDLERLAAQRADP